MERLGARLRQHHMQATTFFIGWKSYNGWLGNKHTFPCPTQDGYQLFQTGQSILESVWRGQGVYQVQVTALNPQSTAQQLDLFVAPDKKREHLQAVIDSINARYGEFTLLPAPLLHRSRMNNVIAPAWKPNGHRRSV